MQKYSDFVTTRAGRAVKDALVTVKLNGTGTLATLYSDNGETTINNPLTTDANGDFAFYAADGRYDLIITAPGIAPKTITDVLLEDPADGNSSSMELLASSDGAELVGYGNRTVADKLGDVVSIMDNGGVGGGFVDEAAALVAAALAAGEGGTVVIPSGVWRFVGPVNITPVNITGAGQGATILLFDNSDGANDGIAFDAPTQPNIQFGITNATIKADAGHGRYAITTPSGSSLNGIYPKPTFEHISFGSTDTADATDSFAQDYSWQFMFLLGDAWCLTLRGIDAIGCYKPEVNPALQFLDGFIRFNPSQGILSARISNVTTHNVANFLEIRQKTYFSLSDVDVARAYRGVYDAPDRVFETSEYAYGESIWNNVIINAQLTPVKLKSRFDLIASGLVIHRSAGGFDHGADWIGLDLERARITQICGIEVSSAGGYTGSKGGIRMDGGDANSFSGVSFGTLDFGAQIGVAGSANGAAQAVSFGAVSLAANVTKVFDLQNARGFRLNGFSKSSSYSYTTFVSYGDSTTQASAFFLNAPTDNALEFDDDFFWVRPNGGTDAKRWRWVATDTSLNLATQGDDLSVGNNALLLTRSGKTVSKAEIRATALYLNGATGIALGASATPANNGDMVFQKTSETQLTIKVKGSDGVVRSANLTLA